MNQQEVIGKLRSEGFRVTKQRKLLIELILREDFNCCKEIYSEALKYDENVGIATVYRMINVMEDIGAINRMSTYQVLEQRLEKKCRKCRVCLNNNTYIELNPDRQNQVMEAGLKAYGYMMGKGREIEKIDWL